MADQPTNNNGNDAARGGRALPEGAQAAPQGTHRAPARRPEQAPSYRHAPQAAAKRRLGSHGRTVASADGRNAAPAAAGDPRRAAGRHASAPAAGRHAAPGAAGPVRSGRHAQPQPSAAAKPATNAAAPQPSEGRRGFGRRGKAKAARAHKPNFFARAINNWWNRLLGIVLEGKVDDQRDQYASHRTTRDYVWNSIGTGAWGMVFPLLTIVCTQLVGAEEAGMFSMAFVTGLLLMFVGNYGVRTYQLSDINEKHSFSDYQVNRVLTCLVMMAAGYAYCMIRGYDNYMFLICMGVYFYKMVDALADVYEGRLQQMDKLYLAGVSQAFRSLLAIAVFAILLFITRNLAAASIAMAIAAALSFVVLTLPLALLETPKSRRLKLASVGELFKQCFPLFIALFMYNLIDNMPKFVMEGTLSYDNQLYFNALYFPAHALLLTVQVVYKPQLVRIANVWAQAKRKRFDLIIIAMLALVLALTVALMFVMSTVGIPVLGFLYGIDFTDYWGLSLIMVAAGGVTAAIDFLYQVVTVLRKQGSVMKLYLITFGFALFIPLLLIGFTGLPGAVLSYLIVMSILLVLLVWEYGRIRMQMSRERKQAEAAEQADEPRLRPSEARAERARRQAVMEKRTGKHSK